MTKKPDEFDKFFDFLKKYSSLKNLLISITIFYILSAIFFLFDLINFKKLDWNIIIYYLTGLITIFFSFLLILGINKKIVPFLEKSSEEIKNGKIWFFGKFINLDTPIFLIRLLIKIYNLSLFLTALIFMINSFIFIIAIFYIIAYVANLFFFNLNQFYLFVGTTFWLNISICIFLIISPLRKLIKPKELLIFIFNEFETLPEVKKDEYSQKLFQFIKGYHFYSGSKNAQFFSKRIILNISLYYENVAMLLINHKIIYNELLPEFKELLIKEDYSGLLYHLKKIDNLCKKNKKDYSMHIALIHGLNKEIISKDPIELTSQLGKLKIKINNFSENLNNIINNIELIVNKRIFFIIVILIVVILFLFGIIPYGWAKRIDFLQPFLNSSISP